MPPFLPAAVPCGSQVSVNMNRLRRHCTVGCDSYRVRGAKFTPSGRCMQADAQADAAAEESGSAFIPGAAAAAAASAAAAAAVAGAGAAAEDLKTTVTKLKQKIEVCSSHTRPVKV